MEGGDKDTGLDFLSSPSVASVGEPSSRGKSTPTLIINPPYPYVQVRKVGAVRSTNPPRVPDTRAEGGVW